MTPAQRLASLSNDQRRALLAELPADDLAALEYSWPFWARPDQLPPPGEFRTLLWLGGRGSGKTKSAAEWVRAELESGRRRSVGIIGPTADAVRKIMVEGPSGLLAVSPPWCRPSYEPSTRKLVYPNGGLVHTFSAEEPDRLRGPNLDGFWIDELCSFANGPAVWDMLQMALRLPGPLGHPPCGIISTTPKATKLLRAIMAAPSTVTQRAKTSDNAANLDASTLQYLHDKYHGTRLGRQELDAELLLDVEGALWSIGMIEEHRREIATHLSRVVVGVDPAGASGKGSAETGIIVCGKGGDGHGYVIADASLTGSPEQWARRAVGAYHLHKANYIVVEKNFGGEMVEHTVGTAARHSGMTPAQRLASLSNDQRRALLAELPADDLAALEYSWPFWARPDQLPPPGEFRTLLWLGGRGSGKTKSAAEWVRAELESGRRRSVGIIGPTADAVRKIMVEGPSGLLAVSPPWCRPSYEPSTRKLVYPNGGLVHTFSAEEPDRLRGPNLDGFWIDELCSFANGPAVWDMLQMALRLPGPLGHPPCGIISTTPKATKLLRAIMAAPSTVTQRAKTSDNAANLDASTLQYLHDKYHGTRLGRQELDAELLLDVEGALWSIGMIEEHRREIATHLSRVVVGVDPAGASGKGSAETGIIVCGKGGDGHGYVIADASLTGSPEQWARRAVGAYHLHKANYIVVEKNFGGEMVEHTIKSIDRSVAIKVVSASRGKALRAESVVSFYEQGRVHHVGNFPILEDQMTQWDPNGSDPSPDRLDALVWACSELMVRQNAVSQYFGIEQTLATRAIASREGGVWPYDAANDPNYSKRARGE